MKKCFGSFIIMCCFLLLGGTCLASSPLQPDLDHKVNLLVDDNFLELNSPIFMFNGRTMISLEALAAIFECEAFAQPDEIKITSRDTFITMFPGQNDYLVNSEIKRSDTIPLITGDGQVYIPLRIVAQELQYELGWVPETFTVILQSQEYSLNHPLQLAIPPPAPPPIIEFKPSGNWGTINGDIPGFIVESDVVIAGYFTRLQNSPQGRTTNIILSCASINGTILQPGEVFSFNQTVGARAVNSGYQIAAIFAGKKVIKGVGGGICQTASTLYNLALEANLQVIERHPHSQRVIYAAPGRDATISWGAADLRFKNTFDFPIKILCRVKGDLVLTALARA